MPVLWSWGGGARPGLRGGRALGTPPLAHCAGPLRVQDASAPPCPGPAARRCPRAAHLDDLDLVNRPKVCTDVLGEGGGGGRGLGWGGLAAAQGVRRGLRARSPGTPPRAHLQRRHRHAGVEVPEVTAGGGGRGGRASAGRRRQRPHHRPGGPRDGGPPMTRPARRARRAVMQRRPGPRGPQAHVGWFGRRFGGPRAPAIGGAAAQRRFSSARQGRAPAYGGGPNPAAARAAPPPRRRRDGWDSCGPMGRQRRPRAARDPFAQRRGAPAPTAARAARSQRGPAVRVPHGAVRVAGFIRGRVDRLQAGEGAGGGRGRLHGAPRKSGARSGPGEGVPGDRRRVGFRGLSGVFWHRAHPGRRGAGGRGGGSPGGGGSRRKKAGGAGQRKGFWG
jgi:hypothetical protein